MIRTAWTFLCRAAVYIGFRSQFYPRVKSSIFRVLFEQKYLHYPVSLYKTLDDLAFELTRLAWTGDGWKQGWDSFSYPGRVEYLLYHATDEARGAEAAGIDCDEFAIYIAAAVSASQGVGWLTEVARPKLLTVTWVPRKGKPSGHNVCLLEFPDAHPAERFAYMDYGMPSHYLSVEEVVRGLLSRYGGPGAVGLGWAICDPESLAPLEVHWGQPAA